MKVQPKIVAAITAAVALYMQAQQAQQEPAAEAPKKDRVEVPRAPFSPWVISGRQSMMELRRMWQMRLVR